MTEIDLNCPGCHLPDLVRKVSAIVTGDTREIHGTTYHEGEYVPYSTTETSHLARLLARPKKPQTSSKGLWISIIIASPCLLSACLGAVLSPMGLISGGGVSPFGGESASLFPVFLIYVIGSLLLAAPIIGLGYWNYLGNKRRTAELLPRWQQADYRWHQLYYCGRDETVFNPYDGASMHISQINNYLYR